VADVGEKFRVFVFLDRKQAREGLAAPELARWQALKHELARELGCDDDERADQRASLRVPVKLRVTFASMGELGQALMTNLSRGGLFVETDHPLEIGTRVVLRLHVEGAGKAAQPPRSGPELLWSSAKPSGGGPPLDEAAPKGLEVEAEVVSQDLGPRGSPRRGLGLRFVETDVALRRELDALYERALEAAGTRGR